MTYDFDSDGIVKSNKISHITKGTLLLVNMIFILRFLTISFYDTCTNMYILVCYSL